MANYVATFVNASDQRTVIGTEGHYSYSYKQDIYSQIFIIPYNIDAGNVSQNTVYRAVLWNATEQTQTLNSITEVGTQGILLRGNPSGDVVPNGYFDYDVEVTTSGPSIIDANYSFNFDNFSSELTVVGSRVVLFGFDINWVSPPKEVFSHYTDVRISYDGTEFRHNLTDNARMQLQYYYTLNDVDRMKLDGLLYSWADKVFLVPIYSQITYTIDPIVSGQNSARITLENTDIQEGMSILIGKNQEVGQIANVKEIIGDVVFFENEISKDFDANEFVIPLCQAYIGSTSSTSHQTDNLTEMTAIFDIKDDTMLTITNNIDNFEEYEGMKILTQEPNRRITINRDYARLVDVVDYGSGVRARVSKDKKPAIVFNYTFECIGKTEINNLKAFFNNMLGMTEEFLVSSFTTDLQLADNIGQTETTLLVKNSGAGSYYLDEDQRSLIVIYLKNGQKFIREIINILGDTEDTEKVVIQQSLGQNVSIDEVNSIQFLSHARFNSDSLQFDFETDEYATASTEIRILRG